MRHHTNIPLIISAKSQNKKGVIFQAWVRGILKKGKILHVFISICLFRMFESLCINVFELQPYIRSNGKTT